MTRINIFLIFILLSYSVKAQVFRADDVCGKWLTSKNECIIEIYRKGNLYYGKIVWLKEPYDKNGQPVKDLKNPDEKLRNMNLLGKTIMYDFEFTGNNKWENGRIYNPDDGNTYQAFIRLIDYHTLQLKGYLGISLLGMSTTWKRVW